MSAAPRLALSRRDLLCGLCGLTAAGIAGCQSTAPTVGFAKGSPATPTAFGSQVYPTDTVANDIALLGQLGAKYVRASVQFDASFLDAVFAAAGPAGMRVVLISAYAKQPVNIANYAAATAAIHATYAAANPIWEIYNEPNLAQYWGATPDVGTYTKLFLATAQALRAVGATDIWTGGTSGVDVGWISSLVQGGAFTLATGCAVHSYQPPGDALPNYAQAIRVLPAGTPIHTTETCVPSSSNQSDFFNQMWYIHREFGLPTMLWCEFVDGSAGTGAPFNENYGLVSSSYTPKPVFATAKSDVAQQ